MRALQNRGLFTALSAFYLVFATANIHAGSATWLPNPVNGNWDVAVNWTAGGPPDGGGDTASFATSSQTSILLSFDTEVNGITYSPGANAFSVTIAGPSIFTISGVGVTNSSSAVQNFINTSDASGNSALTLFTNSATAGTGITFTNNGAISFDAMTGGAVQFSNTANAGSASFTNNAGGAGTFGGYVLFTDSATANNASFLNKGATNAALGGIVEFVDTSTAGNSTIVNEGSIGDGYGGLAQFYNAATANNATITNNGSAVNGGSGGGTIFGGDSNASAGSATLIANGGSGGGGGGVVQFGTLFRPSATDGGTARVKVFGNGTLDITNQYVPITVGSVEGTGLIIVGGQNLTVGRNNLSTTFSGLIKEQGQIAGYQGSFSKIGSGTLTFEGMNNNHIGDSLTLGLNTGSPVNLNFTGAADAILSLRVDGVPQAPGVYGGVASGAPHQIPQLTGSGRLFVRANVVSRKMHGGVPFDIPLRFNWPAAIECRSGGAGGNYQMVVSFANPATFSGAGVTGGDGSVSSATGNGTTTITVNLVNVSDDQIINVTLGSVNDGTTTADLQIPMSILIGDTNGNGTVNASDVSQTKAQAGQPITASNFREDVNGNGTINASDVSLVKSRVGTALP